MAIYQLIILCVYHTNFLFRAKPDIGFGASGQALAKRARTCGMRIGHAQTDGQPG